MLSPIEMTSDIDAVTAAVVLVGGSAAGIALADLGRWLYRQIARRPE